VGLSVVTSIVIPRFGGCRAASRLDLSRWRLFQGSLVGEDVTVEDWLAFWLNARTIYRRRPKLAANRLPLGVTFLILPLGRQTTCLDARLSSVDRAFIGYRAKDAPRSGPCRSIYCRTVPPRRARPRFLRRRERRGLRRRNLPHLRRPDRMRFAIGIDGIASLPSIERCSA